MIETAFLGTQPGTQPGALIGPSVAKQGGASEVIDSFGSTPAGSAREGLQSSLAPVTKGAFRNSLEEFTGPIALESGTSKLSTQAEDSLAKSQFVQHSDILSGASNARIAGKQPFTASLDQAFAQDGFQADTAPELPGDALKNGQAASRLVADMQKGSDVSTQLRQVPGQAVVASGAMRTVTPSGLQRPIPSHGPRTSSLDVAPDSSSPKMTGTAAAPLTANGTAALTPPMPSTTVPLVVTPTESPVTPGAEIPVAVQPQSILAVAVATTQPDPSATVLSVTGSKSTSSMVSPAVSKSSSTKPGEAKNDKPAEKSLAAPSLPPVQQSSTPGIAPVIPQAIMVTAANDRTPEAGPVATTPAQAVHAVSAPPKTSTQLVPLLPANLGAQPLEASTAPLQEPGAKTQTPNPSDVPATFAQVLDLQDLSVPAIQRPFPLGLATAKAVTTATHLPSAAIGQTPGLEKPGADKSFQSSDQFQAGDAAASAPAAATRTMPPAPVAESSLTVTAAVPHIAPASSVVQSGTTATAVPSSVHPLSASPNDSSATLTYAPASDGSGFAPHTTLLSTPNVLEVGVASGSHGWLKVRAELDGSGGVSASVIANSPAAAVTMHKDLPALSAYLSSESVGVSSLVVNQAGASSQALAGGTSHDSTMNPGAGTGGGGPAHDQSPVPQASGAALAEGTSSEGIESLSSRLDESLLPSLRAGPGEGFEAGSWLSVRA